MRESDRMLRKLITSKLSLRPLADFLGDAMRLRMVSNGSVEACCYTTARRGLAVLLLAGTSAVVMADEPAEAEAKPSVTAQQAAQLIESLGAETFAERERAMGEIMRGGSAMAPFLREAIQSHQDPELILRARKALHQMTEDNLETQIETFLSSDPDAVRRGREWFEGWAVVEQILGDSVAVRELFIEVMRSHPDVTASLAGTTAQRTAAAERAATLVQTGMMERRQLPTLADGIAMLLPLTDPAVQVGAGYEATLLTVFNRQFATVRRDAQLWPPISGLLQQWLLRSRIENRADALWYAMQWDLPASSELGLRTLQETTDVEMLQTALQAIARFGSVEDAPKLAKLLDDERPAITRMPVMVGDQPLKVTLADVALATIATLHKVPLKTVGMQAAELHPKVGFLVDHAGYTAEQAAQRAAAIERARQWCKMRLPQGAPRS